MRVTLPDAVTDLYQAYADKQGKPLDVILADRLKRTASVAPGTRVVFVSGAALEAIETRVGGGQITTAEELRTRIDRLASISFMGRDLQLSPNQLEELAKRAERQGKSIDDLILDIWRTLRDDFFYSQGGGEAVIAMDAPPIAHAGVE